MLSAQAVVDPLAGQTVTESKSGSFRLIFDGSTVWVKPDDEFWRVAGGITDTAQPRLLQLIDPSAIGDKLSFGYPGTPVAITPPPASEILVGGQ